jgi:hypothetical protein
MEKAGYTFVLHEVSKWKCINTSEVCKPGFYPPNSLLKQSSKAIKLTQTTFKHHILPHKEHALYPLQGPINAL